MRSLEFRTLGKLDPVRVVYFQAARCLQDGCRRIQPSADTMFIVRASGPCPEDIPEEPTFGGEGEKKFWIFSKSGKEVVLKYS